MTKGAKIFYIAFCTVLAFAVWSLAYGAVLGLLYKDTRILQATLSNNPIAPLMQIWHYGAAAAVQKAALIALVPAIAIGVLICFLGLRERSSPLGEAAFQTIASLRSGNWFRSDGHIFGSFQGKILRRKDDRHHLIIGPTRSGKGAGYVIPNALMHEGSMIVTDLKGEIFKASAGYRQSKGHKVFLFAPGQEQTHRWNPLDFVRQDRGDRTTDIQNIASILIPERDGSDGGFWQAQAQQITAGLVSYILESDAYDGRRNLSEINALINCGVPLQALLEYIKEKEPYLSTFTIQSFNAFIALSDKTASSTLTELQNAMRPFKNERIAAATSVTDIDLASMKRKPISLYLAPNVTDITLLRPLLTLFVQQVMNLLTMEHDPKSVPVYFLLDEFRQLKKMSEIMTKLPYVAGYNIKLAFIIQDLKNLDEIYGETSRHSLLGNCGYQLILGANDQATADYVSRTLGKLTLRYRSESRTVEMFGVPKRTMVEQIRERDLMMPQEVRQMPENKLVMLVEGQPPVFANKVRFFETEPLKGAEKFSQAHIPEVPKVAFLPERPVPMLTSDYQQAGEKSVKPPIKAVDQPTPPRQEEAVVEQIQHAETTLALQQEMPSAEPERASQRAVETAQPENETERPIDEISAQMELQLADNRMVTAEKTLTKALSKKAITTQSKRVRARVIDLYHATVPDPLEPDVRLMDATP